MPDFNLPPSGVQLLKTIRDTCLDALIAGQREKDRVYSPGAHECLRLYLGDHRYLFNPANTQEQFAIFTKIENAANAKRPRVPMFKINDNIAARLVQTHLPNLLGQEITRTVSANKAFIPPPEAYGIVDQQLTMQAYQAGNMQFVQQQQQAVQKYQQDLMKLDMEYKIRTFRAEMMEGLLNYNVQELALDKEMEMALIESLVIGGGVILTGSVDMPAQIGRLVGSQFVSMNDIIFDPDVTRIKDAKWAAIRFRFPKWLISRMTGIPESEIRGSSSSLAADKQYESLLVTAGNEVMRSRPKPKDEVVVYKFWSRMGAMARMQPFETRDPLYAALDDKLGDYVYYLISDCCDYPLNVPPQLMQQMLMMARQPQLGQMQQPPPMNGFATANPAGMGNGAMTMGMQQQPYDPIDMIRAATKWPVSYFLNSDDPWPFTVISYYHRTGSPYPIPPLEFALSYIKFMVWCLGFIADKTYRSQRDFIVCDEKVSEQLINELVNSEDEPIIKIKGLQDMKVAINQLVQYLEAPPLHKDIIDVYEFFRGKVEEMIGADPTQVLMSQDTQSRSATDAAEKQRATGLRVAKMGDDADDAAVHIAHKEALAAFELLKGQDVQFIFGDPGAMAWDQAVANQDIREVFREAKYDVETGRGKRKDIRTRAEQAQQMVQFVLPIMEQFAEETGITEGMQAILNEWAEGNQIDKNLVKLPTSQQLQQIMAQKAAMQAQAQEQAAAQGQIATQHHQAAATMAVNQHAAKLPQKGGGK